VVERWTWRERAWQVVVETVVHIFAYFCRPSYTRADWTRSQFVGTSVCGGSEFEGELLVCGVRDEKMTDALVACSTSNDCGMLNEVKT